MVTQALTLEQVPVKLMLRISQAEVEVHPNTHSIVFKASSEVQVIQTDASTWDRLMDILRLERVP